MTTLHIPNLNEVQRVMADQLYAYPHADDLMDAMERCGIGCFKDEAGDYWFGSDAPKIPEHDRWLYMLPLHERLEHGYGSGRFRELLGCDEDARAVMGPLTDVIEELQDLAQQQAHTLAIIGYSSEAERQVLVHNYLIAVREFGMRGPNTMAPLVQAPWGQNLHDMLRHWDAWCAINNPDGLPYDLVWRMHGLGAYAEEIRTHTQSW